VGGVPGHEASVERGEVGHVTAEPGALLHFTLPEALVCTPLTHLRGFVADLDALALSVTQALDLRDSFCEGHCVQISFRTDETMLPFLARCT
jgi:hypothetical protein